MSLLYRLLGGGRLRQRTPETEQNEHDLAVLAHLLWEVRDILHYMPVRIAQEVRKTFSE